MVKTKSIGQTVKHCRRESKKRTKNGLASSWKMLKIYDNFNLVIWLFLFSLKNRMRPKTNDSKMFVCFVNLKMDLRKEWQTVPHIKCDLFEWCSFQICRTFTLTHQMNSSLRLRTFAHENTLFIYVLIQQLIGIESKFLRSDQNSENSQFENNVKVIERRKRFGHLPLEHLFV